MPDHRSSVDVNINFPGGGGDGGGGGGQGGGELTAEMRLLRQAMQDVVAALRSNMGNQGGGASGGGATTAAGGGAAPDASHVAPSATAGHNASGASPAAAATDNEPAVGQAGLNTSAAIAAPKGASNPSDALMARVAGGSPLLRGASFGPAMRGIFGSLVGQGRFSQEAFRGVYARHADHIDAVTGQVKGQGFTDIDDVRGAIHFPGGSNAADTWAARANQDRSFAMLGVNAVMGAAAASNRPSVDALGEATQGLMGAGSMGAFAMGGPYGMMAGAALGVGSGLMGMHLNTENTQYGLGKQYAQLERSEEVMAHMGARGNARLSESASTKNMKKLGYGLAERTYMEAEQARITGKQMSMDDIINAANLGASWESKGVSRGALNALTANSRYGGGDMAGDGYKGTARAVDKLSRLGGGGDALTEMLQRIASTVEGIGARGLKIDKEALTTFAADTSFASMVGAGGDRNKALLYEGSAAAFSGGLISSAQNAAHMLDYNTDKFGAGVALSGAVRRAGQKDANGRSLVDEYGGNAHLATQVQLGRDATNPEQMMRDLDEHTKGMGAGARLDLLSNRLASASGKSVEAAAQYVRGRDAIKAFGAEHYLPYADLNEDKAKLGDKTKILGADAKAEQKLVDALELNRKAIEASTTAYRESQARTVTPWVGTQGEAPHAGDSTDFDRVRTQDAKLRR